MDKVNAWEVWSEGDSGDPSGWIYVASYTDKGDARHHMRRLQASHPGYRYELRQARIEPRHLITRTRATRRGMLKFAKDAGWS